MTEQDHDRSDDRGAAATPEPQGLSRPAKIILGLLTLWVPIYMVLFFLAMILASTRSFGDGSSDGYPLFFSSLFFTHILTMLVMGGTTVFYAVTVYREKAFSDDRRILWMVIVLLGGFIGQAVYYVLWILKRDSIVSGAGRDGERV